MAKTKSAYVCQSCGYQTTQWVGQCQECGEWNTFVETVLSPAKASFGSAGSSRAVVNGSAPTQLSKIKLETTNRITSGIKEFDRVLGGGFVPGQVILLAGDPGIGKSTILTQIAAKMPNSNILYVCGEESASQIKVRTQRMNYAGDNLLMLAETDVETITYNIEAQPNIDLIIVDSIQTLVSQELVGMAGSVGQVRGSTQKITESAKKLGIPAILVGHVTKEGTVAGPKVLEHIVDTVLYLEGDSQHLFRILKTSKNRFGPVSEVGIFEMTDAGMREITNPSELFLSQKLDHAVGSCVTVSMEGFRPLLFEVQALTVKTSFGYPRRTTSGFNANRLQVLLAILEKNCGLNLNGYDVYLNIAGGFKLNEYAADLAVCLAIASSIKNKPISNTVAAFGECGLSGEVRRVSYEEKRLKEAQKLGYTSTITPAKVKSINAAVNMVFKDQKLE